ncbi:PLP-dependent aminotransferase family protein [Rhodovastum atsumiense]|uniref:PLP-dependent aminotransferase family protein n=1 Tax=Rhodovastum atsumiense TaxID=504468 RepID=A0A5M6IKL3_9PROT|nr:PLP-dependent aminotransferase family protein [Rhodovastum atsumiense]KAA5608722.1 PLP-dependent aminotransferase family protein [Rhodovastum atsumiense]CAH2604966.1 PLP-dependent aminotransferase family protein [Rhodovastum atsumiense]
MPDPLDQTRQQAVFDRLRQGILAGTLAPGAQLPPTRRLAEELGVARQTVVLAYERLAAEGYVRARVGSGTFVAADLPDAAPSPAPMPGGGGGGLSCRGAALAALPASASGPVADGPPLLAPGVPAPELFPATAWARCAARVLRDLPPALTGYPDLQGLPALRAEIAAHLAGARGLIVDPDHIVVTAGTQQALRVAAELLLDPGDTAWVEDPGYIAGRGALRAAGAMPVAVPSDTEGLDVAAGLRLAPAARLALVAPSHATPLGGALPVGRRLALLDWAAQAGAWILEDDADSEFRWQGKPLPPLASLDRVGRVIYCGTFSKSLAPALRLGFAVVPPPLTAGFVRARALMDRGPATFEQATLAAFMQHGGLAAHIRRMRTEYARRRSAVLAALAQHCPALEPVAAPGGLHLVLKLPAGCDEAAVVRAARARGVAAAPLGAYFAGPPRLPGLVTGFAATPVARAAEAARRLAMAVQEGQGSALDLPRATRPLDPILSARHRE